MTLTEQEQRDLFKPDSLMSHAEAFEILNSFNVDRIEWDEKLDGEYGQWIYFNVK